MAVKTEVRKETDGSEEEHGVAVDHSRRKSFALAWSGNIRMHPEWEGTKADACVRRNVGCGDFR